MIDVMAKIEIIGLLEDLDDTLELLQHLGTLQIEDIPTLEGTGETHVRRIHLDEKKEHILKHYDEITQSIGEILDILDGVSGDEWDIPDETKKELHALGPDDLIKHIAPVAREVRRMGRQLKNLQQDIDSARKYESLINTFLPLLEQVGAPHDMEQIGLILNSGELSIFSVLKNRIMELAGKDTQIFHQEMPDKRIGVFIVVKHEHLAAVRKLLGNEGVTEYHIPREFRRTTFRESIEAIRSRIDIIPAEIRNIETRIEKMKREKGRELRYIHIFATNRINQLKVLSRLVRTKYTFVISGWTPVSDLESMKRELADRFDGRVHVGSVRMTEVDFQHIPTQLSNPHVLRPFNVLMKLLPPPRYNNIDATPFIALFFPVFFGVILGDMAYGLLLLAIAGIMKFKVPRGSVLSDAATVAITMALSTVFFGFLYGEFLGNIGYKLGLRPMAPWLHREAAIEILLLITLAIGALHILLAFMLKTYVSIAMKHTKGAVEGMSKIMLVFGIVGLFTKLLLGFPAIVQYVSFGMLGIAVIGIAFTEGLVGVLEIFSIFGNILSYSRIMAVGLASVILALVGNRLAEESGNIIAAVLIGFLLHAMNFIMGVFSPTIHSLRLHYVEFFGKFFEASGRAFQPFKSIGEEVR